MLAALQVAALRVCDGDVAFCGLGRQVARRPWVRT